MLPQIKSDLVQLIFYRFSLNEIQNVEYKTPSDSFQSNLNKSELELISTEFSIRMNPRSKWFKFILIEDSNWTGMNRIDLHLTDLHRMRSKIFFYWFGDRLWNSSDSLGLNSNPKLSLGYPDKNSKCISA